MRSDAQLLGAIPDHVRFDALLKARPATEGDRRFLFLEASNEAIDHAGEVTLQKALEDSADYYLRHGNVDIGHYTVLQGRSGVKNFMDYEIGRPVDVRVSKDKGTTFVKAELFTGSSPQAVNANMVWESMTRQKPPMRWYPSIGGAVLAKAMAVEKGTGRRVPVITKVRWNNVALDRCPVNGSLSEASALPLGVFAKSMGGQLVLKSAMTVGYGTDSATFTGARALNTQSLDGRLHSYWDFREDLAKAIQAGAINDATTAGLQAYAVSQMGIDEGQAAGLVRRFLQDLRSMTKGNPA
jgi:hypothetical protein